MPRSIVDPSTGRDIVVIRPDWRELYPFSARFSEPRDLDSTHEAGAPHQIDLATIRFTTNDLVIAKPQGTRVFEMPDLRSFPPQLVRRPFERGDRQDYFIVQAGSPEAQSRLRRWLDDEGMPLLDYIPDLAYLVRASRQQLAAIEANPDVFWVGFYQPAFRVDPRLDYVIEANASQQLTMAAVFDRALHEDEDALDAALRALGLERGRKGKRQSDLKIHLTGRALQARDVATLEGCLWVERFAEPRLHNNVARRSSSVVTGRGMTDGPVMDVEDVWARGLRGEGQIASAADTGLSTGNLNTLHWDFGQSSEPLNNPLRVLAGYALGRTTWDDPNPNGGHGTHTSGSIVGNGIRSGSIPSTNTFPSTSFAGTAPKAQFVFQSVMDSGGGLGGIPADLNTLFQQTYDDGARVHSNSWGAAVAGEYTTNSQELDQFTWRNPDMVITFSAGNSGVDTGSPDGVINPDSIGAPGTAKNCITVGASENYRPGFVYEYPSGDCTSSNGIEQKTWGWFNSSSFGASPIFGDLMANDASGMGAFSSRGPTDDSRFKPDIVAPGIAIISTRTEVNQGYEQWGICDVPEAQRTYYLTQGGTSMANPLTAGAATLVRQYYADGWHANGSLTTNGSAITAHSFSPSAALVKATLINGAWDMNPGQYGTGADYEIPPDWDTAAGRTLPNNAEGYGRVDLENSLFPNSGWNAHANRKMLVHDITAGLQTGQNADYNFVVGGNQNPLVVTLVWTDPPAAAGAGTKLVNNLDLTVTAPGGATTYYPNGIDKTSGADSLNNVEQVKVTSPAQGTWTITIAGTSIPGNAEIGSTTQPYALVVSGVSCTPPPAPTIAAAPDGNNNIEVSWSAVGGLTYAVYRGLASGGPYTLIGTTSTSPYDDSTVDGGVLYYYVVRAINAESCESLESNETSATAEGACNLAPSFAGLTAAASDNAAACGITLSWSAATAPCGGAIRYSVYRSTIPGFAPTAANRIAEALDALSYADGSSLTSGMTYYYVVRAIDISNGSEDSNTVERSAAALGPYVTQDVYFDDFDGTRPADAAAYWLEGTFATDDNAAEELGFSTCRSRSTSTAYKFGGSVCNDYTAREDNGLVLGGNNALPGINGFVIPSNAQNIRLRFWHAYDLQAALDGARLYFSTSGATTGYLQVPDTFTPGGPYISAGGYTGTISSGTIEAWNGLRIASGFTEVVVNCDALAGQTVWFLWRFTTSFSGNEEGYYLDDVHLTWDAPGTCNASPSGPEVLSIRSTWDVANGWGANQLEWRNPEDGPLGSLRVVRKANSCPTTSSDGTTVHIADTSAIGQYATWTDTGLTTGETNCYAIYFYSGTAQTGTESSAASVSAWVSDSLGTDPGESPWIYATGAAALTAPGIGGTTVGGGAIYAVSNDRMVHGMNPTTSGGSWPRTTPMNWAPLAMNGPSSSRTQVLNMSPGYEVGGANRVLWVSSQDGYVYAVNGATGAELWTSAVQLGEMIVATPSAYLRQYDPSVSRPDADIIVVGTRSSSGPNHLYGLDAQTGAVLWRFDNSAAQGGDDTEIGIIAAQASVSYTDFSGARRAYFTSRQRGGTNGSSATVWAVEFDHTGVSLVWTNTTVGDTDASAILRGSTIYVGNNEGQVHALDAATGTASWAGPYETNDGPIKGFIWVDSTNGRLYFSTTSNVWAISTGGVFQWNRAYTSPSQIVKPGTALYFGSGDGRLYELSNLTDPNPANVVEKSVIVGPGGLSVGPPSFDPVNGLAIAGADSGAIYPVKTPLP